jgi:hypothetical protein
MANRRWFYMSNPTFRQAQRACEELHDRQSSNTALQVIWNADMTACLVRLDGASKAWRAQQTWMDDCIEVYCRTSHPGNAVLQQLARRTKTIQQMATAPRQPDTDWSDEDMWADDMALADD